ncbi:kinase-like protein [Exidia glandulosa HHB12029]|uniref:Kinase-like protein n=1 Tax=Exidia glandulosa HHB12029 TaxID=1314781 RepID=A0A165EVR3_EXIGL|nr:kinase-like protein [Exidia glandulosa HHB12029]
MGNTIGRSAPVDFDGVPSLFFFKLKDNIGEGAFGKVRIVKHKQTKALYALKYVDKDKCIRKRAAVNTIQERNILEELKHDFIVNLRYAFQDDDVCFFVLDLMLGGDLRQHYKFEGRFSEEVVRFWFAELSGAIAYMHSKRIVHRDIKPDNILLDAYGHVHLTDFNIAVRFEDNKPITGVAGSVAYMAPETFTKRGYGPAVDWWSLAVLTYELLFGLRPFKGTQLARGVQRTDPDTIERERVYVDSLSWHTAEKALPSRAEDWCSDRGLDLLNRLLEREQSKRLGPGLRPGNEELDVIRAHPWFEGLNFDIIDRKEFPPPYVPDPRKSVDPTYAINENFVAPSNLRAQKWNADKDTSHMSPDMRMLHENFLPYDWERPDRFSRHAGMTTTIMTTASSRSNPSSSPPASHAPPPPVPRAHIASPPTSPAAPPNSPLSPTGGRAPWGTLAPLKLDQPERPDAYQDTSPQSPNAQRIDFADQEPVL